jgi:cellulose synthase/poly-beta-1,6-N-acetylglucosamine synthase-like glycosyltransferase
MIDVIITSYNEPKSTLRAVNTFLKQKSNHEMRITVVDPFPEVENFLNENIKDKSFNFFLDPGEGKSYALNILFQEFGSENKNDIFILTDGDVHVSENAVSSILSAFKDSEVGCATGKPITINPVSNKYHYWAHIAFNGIDKFRRHLSNNKKFFECSGYLFAIRKGVIIDFPIETSEDSIIPYLFWKKGYNIKYVPEAKVYVKNPSNWKDWTNQKIRNIKGHENLDTIAPGMIRTKSLANEIKEGAFFAIKQPSNLKELIWVLQLYPARLYIYLKAFHDLKKTKTYSDGWRESEILSTKTLD